MTNPLFIQKEKQSPPHPLNKHEKPVELQAINVKYTSCVQFKQESSRHKEYSKLIIYFPSTALL